MSSELCTMDYILYYTSHWSILTWINNMFSMYLLVIFTMSITNENDWRDKCYGFNCAKESVLSLLHSAAWFCFWSLCASPYIVLHKSWTKTLGDVTLLDWTKTYVHSKWTMILVQIPPLFLPFNLLAMVLYSNSLYNNAVAWLLKKKLRITITLRHIKIRRKNTFRYQALVIYLKSNLVFMFCL